MIEILNNQEKKTTVGKEEYFCVPRNVRQIGEVPADCKIYIEDYAYTYLYPMEEDAESKSRVCLLLGKHYWKDGILYVFIKSAFLIADGLPFTDAVWGEASEQKKKYFPSQEIVGWYLSAPDMPVKITDDIYRAHRTYFEERGKVLLLLEPEERDEAFFWYHQDKLERQMGYYVYYERNEPMQEYLVESNRNESIEVQGVVCDKAVKDFRKIIADKKEEKEIKRNNKFLYAASACLVVAALGVGMSFMNRFPQLQGLRENIEATSEKVLGILDKSETTQATGAPSPKTVEVPTVTETPQAPETTEAPAVTETPVATETPVPTETPIPTETPESAETTAGNTGDYATYTIKEGDTLNVISYRYYGSIFEVADICRLNNMSPEDIIYPGEKILLP
ncbi:MAG: LysM peptidoglycan-binding domain-containing protein [Lachnospiraceae bacterium]|nr:LysM peptidoglycan-binding domain-containing protein [Lachnospiraceae bacterium]